MRLTGWVGNSLYEGGFRGTSFPATAAFNPLQTLATQASLLGGIYLGRFLETHVLSCESRGGTLFDSLAMLAQFHISGRIIHQAFGPGLERFNQELQLRVARFMATPSPRSNSSGRPRYLDLAPALTGVDLANPPAREARSKDSGPRNAPMAMNGIGNGGNETSGTGDTPMPIHPATHVLDMQTRQVLRTRLQEIDRNIEVERQERIDTVEAKGIRRMQRIVRARLKLLDQVEAKIAAGRELGLIERRFVERMGTALAGQENTSGRDALLEQLDYYFRPPPGQRDLKPRLTKAQEAYYRFVRHWNQRRKHFGNPEYEQIHVSEAQRYDRVWTEYRLAIETTLNLYGVTPRRWQGQIIPDVNFRREGNAMLVEPRGWQPGTGFSRWKLWRFLFDDTVGLVQIAKYLKDFDPTPKLYLTLHGRGWGWRMLDRTQTRLRVENTENFREMSNHATIVAPTHDSVAEFPNLPAVLHDYGINAFFLADQKFFARFWGKLKVSLFGWKFSIPIPRFPFGLIRALLGPMDQYGHLAIDRSNHQDAREMMRQAGKRIKNSGKDDSIIIFPGSTRNPITYDSNRNRREGPIHGNKSTIALTMKEAEVPIFPFGLINGGVILPKQITDAFFRRGVAIGREYILRPGNPLHYYSHYESFIWGDPSEPGQTEEVKEQALGNAVSQELDRQFQRLTGRPLGPRARSKAKRPKPNNSQAGTAN